MLFRSTESVGQCKAHLSPKGFACNILPNLGIWGLDLNKLCIEQEGLSAGVE